MTTTSPFLARFVPSKTLREPDRLEKSPPWNQTMTGRLRPSFSAGVQMFSARQSSLMSLSKVHELNNGGNGLVTCGHIGANASASRTSVQGAGGCGGRKRPDPAVEAPYGMPLKVWMPSVVTPRTLP